MAKRQLILHLTLRCHIEKPTLSGNMDVILTSWASSYRLLGTALKAIVLTVFVVYLVRRSWSFDMLFLG